LVEPEKIMLKPQLIKATIAEYPIIQNMCRFYAYDMSRSCGFISENWTFPENGLYESFDCKSYFEAEDRYAFLVKVDTELAGFVLIDKVGTAVDTDWNVGEFFIIAKFQGHGVGQIIAEEVWRLFPGAWEVSVIPENKPALGFWRKVIEKFTNGQYVEEIKQIFYDEYQKKRYILSFSSVKV